MLPPLKRSGPRSFMEQSPVSCLLSWKWFLAHAAGVLTTAIAGLMAPLYAITTSEGLIYTLTASGWVGNALAACAINTTNTSDYSLVSWAFIIAVFAAMIACVTTIFHRQVSTGAWGALAMVAWLPLLVVVLFLATDGFPMPAFSALLPGIKVTITAGWGGILWAQLAMASLIVGGTIGSMRTHPPRFMDPPREQVFLEGSTFQKFETELAIRESLARQTGSNGRL